MEVYSHPNPSLAQIARQSVVALIDAERIERSPDGRYTVFAVSLQTAQGLCEDEAFLEQPTAAHCSGVLIDHDLVLTAGHCIRSQQQCDETAFVFNYHLESPSTLATIGDDDVYRCRQIAVRDEATDAGIAPDFAVVQLDRPVAGGQAPAPIRSPNAAMALGDPLALIGFGSGLPAKIDAGGVVTDPRASTLDYFSTSSDAFGGHSGSPAFDTNLALAGILVAGRAPDYVALPGETCTRANRFLESEGDESVHYLAPVLSRLCEQGWGDQSLCDGARCDGGTCGKAPPPRDAPDGSSGCQASPSTPSSGVGTFFVAIVAWLLGRRRRHPR